MSNKFFASGSNSTFDLTGTKSNAQVEGAPVQLDLSEVKPANRIKTVDPRTKSEVIVQKDVTGENIIFKKAVDVTSTVEQAKAWHNSLQHTSSYGEEFRPLMQIDDILISKYCLTRGVSWEEFWSPQSNDVHLKALLTDPDLAVFRLRSYNSQCKR
jgi:hypothetical protein